MSDAIKGSISCYRLNPHQPYAPNIRDNIRHDTRDNHRDGRPELAEIENLLVVWREQHIELGSREGVNHVLIFENKGDVVGVSNPHPHCQIYATNFVFKTIENEARVSQRHLTETGRALFQDILEAEHRMLATSKLDKTASG